MIDREAATRSHVLGGSSSTTSRNNNSLQAPNDNDQRSSREDDEAPIISTPTNEEEEEKVVEEEDNHNGNEETTRLDGTLELSRLYRRETAIQATLYLGAYCLTWGTMIVGFVLAFFEVYSSLPIAAVAIFTLPSGGFFNILVY